MVLPVVKNGKEEILTIGGWCRVERVRGIRIVRLALSVENSLQVFASKFRDAGATVLFLDPIGYATQILVGVFVLNTITLVVVAPLRKPLERAARLARERPSIVGR